MLKVGLCAALILGAFSLPAEARVCDTQDKVTALLADRYKESVLAEGIVSDRGFMEVYVSQESGTWSVVVTTPQGKSCIIAAGQDFQPVDYVDLFGEPS